MVGFAFSFFTLVKASRQLLLVLFVIPLIFVSGVLRILFFLGLFSVWQGDLAYWVYFDLFFLVQFSFILTGLWVV